MPIYKRKIDRLRVIMFNSTVLYDNELRCWLVGVKGEVRGLYLDDQFEEALAHAYRLVEEEPLAELSITDENDESDELRSAVREEAHRRYLAGEYPQIDYEVQLYGPGDWPGVVDRGAEMENDDWRDTEVLYLSPDDDSPLVC